MKWGNEMEAHDNNPDPVTKTGSGFSFITPSDFWQMEAQLEALTGLKAGLEPFDKEMAQALLHKTLANERRKARRRSPFYDSNRHLALLQLLVSLELESGKEKAPTSKG